MKKNSKYREALNIVGETVREKKELGERALYSAECSSYAKKLGYASWNLLAVKLKKEDLENDVCWHCNDIEDDVIRVCQVCGRTGSSKDGTYKIKRG